MKGYASLDELRARVGGLDQFKGCTLAFNLIQLTDKVPVIDFIVCGDTLWDLSTWPSYLDQPLRLWSLSSRYRHQILSEIDLREDEISLIPRDRLFPAVSHNPVNFPEHFVFAGRSEIATKRLPLMIKVISELRELSGRNLQFHICHLPTSEIIHPKNLNRSDASWIRRHGDLGRNWTSKFQDAAFLSLSNYEYEDCGVAAGEALEKGWPVFLSDWGGHSDYAFHPRACLLPVSCDENPEMNDDYVRAVANRILNQLTAPAPLVKIPSAPFKKPKEVTLRSVQSRRASIAVQLLTRPYICVPRSPHYQLIQKYFAGEVFASR